MLLEESVIYLSVFLNMRRAYQSTNFFLGFSEEENIFGEESSPESKERMKYFLRYKNTKLRKWQLEYRDKCCQNSRIRKRVRRP